MSRIFPLALAAAAFAAPLALTAPASAAPPSPCGAPYCGAEAYMLCLNGVIGTGLDCPLILGGLAPAVGSGGSGPIVPGGALVSPQFERATPRFQSPADWRALNPQPIPPAPAFLR